MGECVALYESLSSTGKKCSKGYFHTYILIQILSLSFMLCTDASVMMHGKKSFILHRDRIWDLSHSNHLNRCLIHCLIHLTHENPSLTVVNIRNKLANKTWTKWMPKKNDSKPLSLNFRLFSVFLKRTKHNSKHSILSEHSWKHTEI